MCGSMVDIQSATAEIRRRKKDRRKKKKPQGKNIMSASATQCGHKQSGIPVDKYVGMVCTPLQRSKLHDWYEPAKIIDLGLLVFTVDHSRQIEQLGTLHTASNTQEDSRNTLKRLFWRLSRELTALTVITKLTTATENLAVNHKTGLASFCHQQFKQVSVSFTKIY